MKSLYVVFLMSVLFLTSCVKKESQTGFAIVVDKETYKQAKSEIEAYAQELELEGLKTFIVVDKWNVPDSIKAKLVTLYHSSTPLEGAVFIGDIPVPMIRDAQHLSSAFKMNQDKYKWNRSSVPSDRFYDDFDLKFKYLKKDENNPLYHYYSLLADSEQKLQPEIYTGRIIVPAKLDKYKQIKAYLKKVTKAHKEINKVDNLLFFAGHGYNSESMVARIDEKVTLLQQFPSLNKQKNGVEFIDYSFNDNIKFRLLSELKRNDLDIAILHHHGGPTAEYLNGMPESSDVQTCVSNIQYYLRSKVRTAESRKKDVNKTIAGYRKSLGVPNSWFNGWDKNQSIKEDSIINANLDIYVEDLDNYKSNARFIIFDACFNGSFHRKDYLAGRYVFSEGRTVVAMANSVNTIQDKWPDEMLGLLDCGARVGSIFKYVCFLETHIIGDPTFQFTPGCNMNLNRDIVLKRNDINYWKRLLDNNLPDVQCLALRMLHNNNYKEITTLAANKYFQSPFNTVRMECLKILSFYNNDDFIKVLCAASEDSYELIRRFAGYFIADCGDERCIPALIKVNIKNNKAKRIKYVFRDALAFFNKDMLMKELNKQLDSSQYFLNKEESRESFSKLIESQTLSAERCTREILSEASSVKDIGLSIRNLRNKPFHLYAKDYCRFVLDTKNDDLRLLMIEALGWFTHSVNKDCIIETCEKVVGNKEFPEVIRLEAIKTINRLKL